MLKPQSGIAGLLSRETLTLSWNLLSHTTAAKGWLRITLKRQSGIAKLPSKGMPKHSIGSFTRDEVTRILEACGRLEDDNPHTAERTRRRARALCLVLLYAGLRISDAVKLDRKAVDLESGKLLLRTMKTGVPLYVRLGDLAVQALKALPPRASGISSGMAFRSYTRALGTRGRPSAVSALSQA